MTETLIKYNSNFALHDDKRTCHKNDEFTHNTTCAVGELHIYYSFDSINIKAIESKLSESYFESLFKHDFLDTEIFQTEEVSTSKPKFPLEYYKLLYEYKGEYLNDATFYKYYGVHPCEFQNPEELDINIPTPCSKRAEDNARFLKNVLGEHYKNLILEKHQEPLILDHLKHSIEFEDYMHNYDI
jgi:hypothetical protein